MAGRTWDWVGEIWLWGAWLVGCEGFYRGLSWVGWFEWEWDRSGGIGRLLGFGVSGVWGWLNPCLTLGKRGFNGVFLGKGWWLRK